MNLSLEIELNNGDIYTAKVLNYKFDYTPEERHDGYTVEQECYDLIEINIELYNYKGERVKELEEKAIDIIYNSYTHLDSILEHQQEEDNNNQAEFELNQIN